MKTTTAILVAITLSLPAILSGQEPYSPTDAERARWTLADMRSWGICFAAYAKDNKAFPVAAKVADVVSSFQPVYIKVLPLHDAWGTEYRIVSDGTHFRIISAGADRKFDESTWSTRGKELDFTADAVMDDSGAGRIWKYE